ncbi:hypothetical protein Dimus_021990 [Dionaea muscipula]
MSRVRVGDENSGLTAPATAAASRKRERETAVAGGGEGMEGGGVMKVAAICGSLRKASFNRGLIHAAADICSTSIKGMEIQLVDITQLPMLNTDLEVNGTYPPVVEEFRQTIKQADCILFASPEYNYSVTAPMKNALDWGSRPPNVWGDKAAAIVSAAGGGTRGQTHLRQIGVFLDIHFINKPEFYVNPFVPPGKFDNDGNLIDQGTKASLKKVLLSLKKLTLRLQANIE